MTDKKDKGVLIARLEETPRRISVVVEDDRAITRFGYTYDGRDTPENAQDFYSRLVDQINGVGERPTAVVVKEVPAKRDAWDRWMLRLEGASLYSVLSILLWWFTK